MTGLSQLQHILHDVGEQSVLLPLHTGAAALITRRGGRILGLYPDPDAPNLLWTSKAFESAAAFREFTTRADGWAWNLGGDRVWIAPEITYNVRDRRDFGGTWNIPAAMDPGDYQLTAGQGGNEVVLRGAFTLTGYHHGEALGEAQVALTKTVYACPNPIAGASLMHGVHYFGYAQDVALERTNPHAADSLFAEAWNLVQLNAGGTLILPVIGAVRASDYVGQAPEAARTAHGGVILLPLDGRRQFKVAYKALCMTGRIGYWQPLPGGEVALLVRDFFNDVANLYAEEPPDQPGITGHSVHVYNDGGGADNGRPFCEMECSGRTLGLHHDVRRTASADTFRLWAYVGAEDAIRQVAAAFLVGAP
ncbi:MAG: hypothetical protein IPK19_38945 [Chloroflexi bacterium]|nr:hypothetical protein [Chloroflexota bacterium]